MRPPGIPNLVWGAFGWIGLLVAVVMAALAAIVLAAILLGWIRALVRSLPTLRAARGWAPERPLIRYVPRPVEEVEINVEARDEAAVARAYLAWLENVRREG